MKKDIFSSSGKTSSGGEGEQPIYRQDNDTFFNRITVEVNEPGTLEEKFNHLNSKDMTGIRVVGPIDDKDLAFLAKLCSGNELDSLHSINLHDAVVTRIPDYCFEGLAYLTHFYFPQTLKAIGSYAFAYCNALQEAVLPNSLESIGEKAFVHLHLKKLNLPASVTDIGEGAFAGIKELQEVTIDKANTAFRLEDGLLTDIKGKKLLQCFNYRKGDVHIAETIETIGTLAFGRAQEITAVYIPASVTHIGNDAFASMYALERIEVAAENTHYCSVDGVLFDKQQTMLISYPPSKKADTYIVPATVRRLATGAFQEAGGQNTHTATKGKSVHGLKEVVLPEGLEAIGDNAFLFSGVEKVNIPSTVRTLGHNCFYYTDIETMSIPEGVERLEEGTFAACYSLKKVVLPSTLTYIGAGVFELSDALAHIEIHTPIPPRCDAEAFSKLGAAPQLHIAGGDIDAYKADAHWAELINKGSARHLASGAPLKDTKDKAQNLKGLSRYQPVDPRLAILAEDLNELRRRQEQHKDNAKK